MSDAPTRKPWRKSSPPANLTKEELDHLRALAQMAASPYAKNLPVRVEIQWTPQMGARLMRARSATCPRVDRRRSNWRHVREQGGRDRLPECTCISQQTVARQLSLAQNQISKLERGYRIAARVEIAALWSIFGEATVYIITGHDRVRYEGFPQRPKRNS